MSLDEQKIALDFVDYLEKEKFIFVKDNGYWKDKIYYLIKYKNEGICFILIKDPEEPENYGTNKEKGNCEMKYVIREATNKDTEFICRINKYTMEYDYPEEKTQY